MKPEDSNSQKSGAMALQPGHIEPEPGQQSEQSAANVIRSQIDNLFGGDQKSPHEKTEQKSAPAASEEQLKAYHSAWQNYYQKYYEGYYNHHLNKAKEELRTEAEINREREERLYGLRKKLLSSVKDKAKNFKKSRHFIPIISALSVMLIFLFLQYNQILIANAISFVSPGSINPQNIVINPNAAVEVSSEPRLIIPKINVDVPVHYDVGNDHESQMAAMENGVAQFAIDGASAHPGEVGNTVIAGHSSNDWFGAGDYKFIFAMLDRLTAGDTIYANYNSIRYTYVVTKTEVVKPTELNKLVYAGDKPIMTLVTCVPLGTAAKRLLVTAEQISPDPSTAKVVEGTNSGTTTTLPGNGQTLLEKLFGIK